MSSTTSRGRADPKRSPQVWACEFARALKTSTGVSVPRSDIERLAARDFRLRERRPGSVVALIGKSARAAGFTLPEWISLIERQPALFTRQAASVTRGLTEISRVLHMTAAEARSLAGKQPMLLCFTAGGIAVRLTALRRAVGLTLAEARRCAARDPRLLTRDPKTFARLVGEQRRALDLSPAAYRKLIMRRPRFLMHSPAAIRKFRDGVSAWGLEPVQAQKLLREAPELVVAGRAETMQLRFAQLARGLGCDIKQIVAAVQVFPPLAYQDPAKLLNRVASAAASLEMDPKRLAASLLRAPTLLARRTEDWPFRLRLILRILKVLGVEATADDVFATLPAALTYRKDRLLQRYVTARLGLWTWNWPTLLTYPDAKIKQRLDAHFRAHPEQQPLRRALAKRNLV
jgi:hypothetical protein